MSKINIKCDVEADQSCMKAIKKWVIENGHKLVNDDIRDYKDVYCPRKFGQINSPESLCQLYHFCRLIFQNRRFCVEM